MRDSFGVELEPTYNPIATDWNEQDLFLDDKVYKTEDGYVKVGDEREYLEEKYGSMYIEDIINNLKGAY